MDQEREFMEEEILEGPMESEEDSSRARGRGKETMFRVTIRSQIDQVAIADNKANMIISINTILISLTIAIVGSGVNFADWQYFEYRIVFIPLTILLIGCAISAVFAILAARPRLIRGVPNYKAQSMLFFGNFRHMSVQQYLEEMKEVLSSNDNIYRSMSIDLYNNGQVLNRKYRLLTVSYTAFLLGVTICVIVYLALLIAG